MNETCHPCAFEQVARVEFANLKEDIREVKARACRLETALSRGVMLLIANLAGIVVMLMQQLL